MVAPRAPLACRSQQGRLEVLLSGWYLSVHAPVATALCGSWGKLHPSPGDQHTGGIWEQGAMLGCCCVMGGDQVDLGHSQGMAEPLWCSWLVLGGLGLALLPISRAQPGMGHGPARHTLAPNIGEDVVGRMWSAGSQAWLSGRSEMRVWLNLWGYSVAWGAWPVGEVGMWRGSSSTAGQAIINMGFLRVDRERPSLGLPASSSQAPGICGPQSVLALSPS